MSKGKTEADRVSSVGGGGQAAKERMQTLDSETQCGEELRSLTGLYFHFIKKIRLFLTHFCRRDFNPSPKNLRADSLH